MTKKSSPISTTPIGWLDYLDFWAEFNISNLKHLDFLDFHGINPKKTYRSSGLVFKEILPSP